MLPAGLPAVSSGFVFILCTSVDFSLFMLMQACRAEHPDNAFACMFAQHILPTLDLPVFVLQSKYDSWQIVSGMPVEEHSRVSFSIALSLLARSAFREIYWLLVLKTR